MMETSESHMEHFCIKFFIQLPEFSADFDYQVLSDQLCTGSIILKHVPLETAEHEILLLALSLME